jgi:Ca2+-binding RTX toxin-like protein
MGADRIAADDESAGVYAGASDRPLQLAGVLDGVRLTRIRACRSGPIEVIELTGSLNTFANGEAGANTLLGNSGANTLDGRGGNDILDGRDGDDVLKIGSDTGSVGGATNMTGGAGADTFWTGKGYRGDHSSGANQLQINDFTSGVDHIRFGIATTATAPTTLDTTAVYGGDTLAMVLDRAASGSGSPTAPTISQFVFGADTYLVLDLSTATTFFISTITFCQQINFSLRSSINFNLRSSKSIKTTFFPINRTKSFWLPAMNVTAIRTFHRFVCGIISILELQ